jgi:hypothetical protein
LLTKDNNLNFFFEILTVKHFLSYHGIIMAKIAFFVCRWSAKIQYNMKRVPKLPWTNAICIPFDRVVDHLLNPENNTSSFYSPAFLSCNKRHIPDRMR